MFYQDITLEDCYKNSDICDFECDGDSKAVDITYRGKVKDAKMSDYERFVDTLVDMKKRR